MPKRNDGNEQDLRVRPALDAPSLADNPYGEDRQCTTAGQQTDYTVAETPDGELAYDWQDVSDICPQGFSPLTVDRLFIRLLKNHFGNPDKIVDPVLKDYAYSDDSEASRMRIVMNTTFDGVQSSILPSLVIKRGRQRMQRVVMGDYGEAGDIQAGLPHYIRFIQGSHRLLCIGQSDGFTESLAFEVFTLLNCLSPNLRQDLPFHDFQVTDLSEMGLIEDLGNTLGVAIECVYTYEYGWTLREIAPTLTTANARPRASTSIQSIDPEL